MCIPIFSNLVRVISHVLTETVEYAVFKRFTINALKTQTQIRVYSYSIQYAHYVFFLTINCVLIHILFVICPSASHEATVVHIPYIETNNMS
jgi:hypothetical protein